MLEYRVIKAKSNRVRYWCLNFIRELTLFIKEPFEADTAASTARRINNVK